MCTFDSLKLNVVGSDRDFKKMLLKKILLGKFVDVVGWSAVDRRYQIYRVLDILQMCAATKHV